MANLLHKICQYEGTRLILGVGISPLNVRSFTIKTEEQSKHSGNENALPVTCNRCSWVSKWKWSHLALIMQL